MSPLSNADVHTAITAAREAATTIAGQSFAVCIVDPGGHVLGLVRDTAAAISATHSAETKARTAVYLQADTGGLPPGSPVVPAMAAGLPYPVNVFEGGLLIRRRGAIVGAVGVAGSPVPGHDLAVARAAAEALTGPESSGGSSAVA